MTTLALAIIPARYSSSRFPGKPLALIAGKSLIQRTYEQVQRCTLLQGVCVATDDQRIYDHVNAFGGHAVMTPSDCPTGTDRLVAALTQLPQYAHCQIVLNVQGDEPLIDPAILSGLIDCLENDRQAVASTPVAKITTVEEAFNRSIVKCVRNLKGHALYFSRSLLPAGHQPELLKHHPYYRHLGVYAYRRDFLTLYASLPATPLQLAEDLEQLKILEYGYTLNTLVVNTISVGVDHPEDIQRVEEILCAQNTSLSPAASAPH